MLKFKICIAGAKNVGKSSLIARYCDNVFDENMLDTIGVAFKRKKIQLEDNVTIDVNIWDLGGEETYRNLYPKYLSGTSAALILYDTTRKETIDDVKNWVELMDEYAGRDNIKVLIGTKIDLKDLREISKEEAEKTCADFNWSVKIFETSSKTGENIEEAFLTIAREIFTRRFQKCSSCGDYFPNKLKFCVSCGERIEIEVVKTQ